MRSWHHALRDAGHEVTSIGKLHFRGAEGDDHGFSQEIIPMHVVDGKGDLLALIRDEGAPPRMGASKMRGYAGPGESDYTRYDRDIPAHAQIWLRERAKANPDKPWCLFVSLVTPHFPLTAPPEHYYRYPPEVVGLPKLYAKHERPTHPFVQDYARIVPYDAHVRDEADLYRMRAGYYGLVSFMDEQIGKIIACLEDCGFGANTRVLYSSDHGDNVGARGLWGKSVMYEEAVGVPMILAGPGVAAGAVCDTPVSLTDAFATVLDAVGCAEAPPAGSTSLFDIAAGAAPDRAAFSEYHATGSREAALMLRQGRWKYVRYVTYPSQLFDLDADPEELDDRAADPACAGVVAGLEALLRARIGGTPAELDARVKARQAELVALNGGRESSLGIARADTGDGRRGEAMQLMPRQPIAEDDVVGIVLRHAGGIDRLIQPPAAEQLHGPRAEQGRLRMGRGAVPRFDQHRRDAAMREIDAEREAHRAAARDQDRDAGGHAGLLDPDVAGADDAAVALGLFRQAAAHRLRAIGHDLAAQLPDAVLDRCFVENGRDLAFQARDHGGRGLALHQDALPGAGIGLGPAHLAEGRQVGQVREAARAGHRDAAHLVVDDEGHGLRGTGHRQIGFLRDQRLQGGRAATIRHVFHRAAPMRRQRERDEMRERAGARIGGVEPPGIGLHIGREPRGVLDGEVVVHGEDVGREDHHLHRRQIPVHVEGHAREQEGVGRQDGDIQQHHRMAIGTRLRHRIRADIAARAGPVLDDHVLPDPLLEGGRDQPGHQAAFGNGAVFIEKFLEHARHVEVQTIGDKHGNAVHLFERDCSTQRRHQKLIEEGPAPLVERKRITPVLEAAARLIKEAGYSGAATVEFLMDDKQNFYMLEVNTRVQVEHPVTELITGVDIVKTMIMVAAGAKLPFKQSEIQLRGHAIECRINAEDPAKGFRPSPGRIGTYQVPGGPGVRLDSHVVPGYVVPPNYDSMVGKLLVHAESREEAIRRMRRALREFVIGPIKTTIPLHLRLMENQDFVRGGMDIHYLERLLKT
ncbi:sulfatase-like hydrolase/transferase [Leptolyngbya sp. 15MV]|nr:sulfatase-like hydrolase/transferase [Leptolyngbya sp. 15MV]